jgi:hypothetical protein
MGDDQDRLRAIEDAAEALIERLGIERGEALVENDEIRVLEQRSRDEEPASLAVRELPAGLAELLDETAGHSPEEIAKAELEADLFGGHEIIPRCGPAAAHQQIEPCNGATTGETELGGWLAAMVSEGDAPRAWTNVAP